MENKNWILGSILIGIFLSFILVPMFFAINDADNLISGDSARFELEINTKNASLPNTTFILILQNNGNYYLVERENIGNKSAKLYVIPEREINMIIMRQYPGSGIPLRENLNLMDKIQNRLNSISMLGWETPNQILGIDQGQQENASSGL